VVGHALRYLSAYDIERGQPHATEVRRLTLPHPEAAKVRVAFINATHGWADTVAALSQRAATVDPDLLVWNGDVCDHFSDASDVPGDLLRSRADAERASAGGWASTRPLLYVLGNHDIRGAFCPRDARATFPDSASLRSE